MVMKALPFALALLLGAAGEDSGSKVLAEAKFAAEGTAGGTARLEVKLTVAPGWHFYGPGDPYEGQAVAFSVKSGGDGLEFGAFTPDHPPHPRKYEFEDEPRMEYEGEVTFVSEVKIPAGTAAGERTVSGVATVNACDAAMCLPAGDSAWSAKLVVTSGAARLPDSADRVKVRAASMQEGSALGVTLEIDDGWHVYGPGDFEKQDTVVRITKAPAGVKFGAFAPDRAPETTQGRFDDGPRKEFHGTVTYAADVDSIAVVGSFEVEGEVEVAACNAEGCLPLGKATFKASLTGTGKKNLKLEPGPARPPVATSAPKPEEGITLAFLLAAVVAGLLTIATPCVFPMIPLTVSLLTKRAEKEPGRILSSAVAYGAGMFVSLAGIGLAMSLLFGVAPSDLALSPGFNIAIFAFLLYLALSLFGAYDIQLPAFMTDWAQSKAGTGGGGGLFFMGVVLAFTSFACAAPFAGVLVVEARTSVVKGIVGMGVYAGTFTVPFFLTALFPGVLKKLPRSGGWLNAVKVVMGFVEVAAAFKFLRAADLLWEWGIFTRSLVVAVWIACAFGACLYLLGLITLPHDTKAENIGVLRLLWALAFGAAGFLLIPGVLGRPLPAVVDAFILVSDDEPMWVSSAKPGAPEAEPAWIRNDLDLALREAKAAGKPVFVDFTGFG